MQTVTLVLSLPPTDNRLYVLQHNRQGECMHRLILSNPARLFIEETAWKLKSQWPRNVILSPTAGHQLHIKISPHVRSWKADVSNFIKLVKDSLQGVVYDNDRFVHMDFNDSVLDKEHPRIILEIPMLPEHVAVRTTE